MRNIPESLKAKMRLMSQTSANNADPRLDAIISRHVIPIQEYKMWQTSKVADFSGRVSIAVPRPDHRKMPESILIGGIDTRVIKIYQAKFDGINAPELWNKVLEIPDALDFCMAYEGRYRPWKKGVEFYTPAPYPWVFWIDSTNSLWAQVWGNASSKVLIGTNVTSCSSTMGIDSVQRDWGQGLIIAWTTLAGSVFYAQLTDTWSEGVEVTWAPPDAVEIVVSRVADVRLAFLVKDIAGTVTAMYFRSVAISTSNYEQLEISRLKVSAKTIPVTFTDLTFDERVEVASINPETALLSVLPPEIVSVSNIDDGTGNFGRLILLEFKEPIFDFEGQQATFKLVDSASANLLCLAIAGHSEPNTLLLEMQDFNNANGVCAITYTPGTLRSGITPAPYLVSLAFTPVGLIPLAVDPPVVISVINIEEVDPEA